MTAAKATAPATEVPKASESAPKPETSRAVLEETENSLSAARSRYLLIGSATAIETFCLSRFGKGSEELPNVWAVTRYSDVSAVRMEPSWRQRGTGYRTPVIMLLPGWSRESNLLSEALLFELAALDEGR